MSAVLAIPTLLIHLMFFHFTSIVAYGEDEPAADLLPIIINEIEINPSSSDQNGSRWIELLNVGDVQLSVSTLNLNVIVAGRDSSSNITQLRITPGEHEDHTQSSTTTIAPHNRYVVDISIAPDLFDDGLITLQLFQEQVLLDEVEGINDNVADDRTWQRFPDGEDSGYFEDWIFAEATKGKSNGNMGQVIAECYLNPLCMSINIPLHKLEIIDVNRTTFTIDAFATSSITNLSLDQNQKKISIELSESRRDPGFSFIHLTFPKILLSGNFLVNIDNEELQQSFFTVVNDTHSRLIIEYQPGDGTTVEIVGTNVIPELGDTSVLIIVAAITSVIIFLFIQKRQHLTDRNADQNGKRRWL